jgi:acyl carrier protein
MDRTQDIANSKLDVAAEVERFIRKNFFYDGPPLAPGASLMDSGILDSTGVLELVTYLEEAFGVSVDDTDLTPDNLDSLGRIAAFVEGKRGVSG